MADKDEDRESLIAKEGGDANDKVNKEDPEGGDDSNWFPYYDFMRSVFRRFDSSFVIILILENFNFGLWTMVSLASQDLFKAYMNEDPANMSVYNSIITLPWCFKILFGLISDNVPLCGLKRKPYLVFFGLVQFLMMLSLVLYDYESAVVVTMLLFSASLSMAFSNVVVDAILVVQARKDPYLGSQDLFSIAWLSQGVAGVIGCCIAAFVLQDSHPKWAFLTYGCWGLVLFVGCFFLSAEAEREYLEGEEPELTEFSSEYQEGQTLSDAARVRRQREAERPARGEEGFSYNFKRNMAAIWWALGRREIYCVVIYFLVDGLSNPSFGDYSYFFLMNIIGVSKFMFAMITLVGSICSVIGVLLYEAFLKETEVRTVLAWNVALAALAAWLNYCFAMRWNLEVDISDYCFIIFTDVVFGAITTAFGTLPLMALFAKITPRRIEGTIFAFLTGTSNLDAGVLQPMVGTFIATQVVGIDKSDDSMREKYPTLQLISFFTCLTGFLTIFLIPLKEDIEKWQLARELQDRFDKYLGSVRREKRDAKRKENEA